MNSLTLTPVERIILLDGILPSQGSFLTLKRTQELKDRIIFTEKEQIDWNIKEEGNQVTMNADAAPAEIEIGEIMWQVVKDALKARDDNGTLTPREMSLYEKFVNLA